MLLLALGTGAVWLGITRVGQALTAPVPRVREIDCTGDRAVWRESGPDQRGPMDVPRMQPMHYFVPALGAYTLLTSHVSSATTTRESGAT